MQLFDSTFSYGTEAAMVQSKRGPILKSIAFKRLQLPMTVKELSSRNLNF